MCPDPGIIPPLCSQFNAALFTSREHLLLERVQFSHTRTSVFEYRVL